MLAQTISAEESKAFVLSAVALSASLFNIAFWFGVFGTIFFEHLFFIWVASTVAVVASLFVPPVDALPAFVSWRGRILLLVPSFWLIMEALGDAQVWAGAHSALYWIAAVITVALTLPYLVYVLVLVAVPDVDRLRNLKLRIALISIAAGIALAGFAIGRNHPVFLTCYDFKVAGDDVPDNCRIATPDTRSDQ